MKLKVGDVVNIYKDHQFETKLEGAAVLLEFVEYGHSFTLYNEKLFTKLEDRPINDDGHHTPLTKEQIRSNKVYLRLLKLFEEDMKGVHPDIKRLKLQLKKLNTGEDDCIDNMNSLLYEYRCKSKRRKDRLATLLSYDNSTIIRFIQQHYSRYWSPTIYRSERWKVKFLAEQYNTLTKEALHYTEFTTNRYIRVVSKIDPSEDIQTCEIRKYTTDEDGYSNADRKALRIKRSSEYEDIQDEDRFIIEEDNDNLIDNLIDNYDW